MLLITLFGLVALFEVIQVIGHHSVNVYLAKDELIDLFP